MPHHNNLCHVTEQRREEKDYNKKPIQYVKRASEKYQMATWYAYKTKGAQKRELKTTSVCYEKKVIKQTNACWA